MNCSKWQKARSDPIMQFYEYVPPHFRTEYVGHRYGLEVRKVSWTSPVKTGFPENDLAYAYHYIPKGLTKNMAVFIVHGWGGSLMHAEARLARRLARRGIHAVLPALPFHYHRTPKGLKSGAAFFDPEIARNNPPIRQAVIDVRCLADYFGDFTLGVTGTSLGGIIVHLLMGVDSRFKVGCSVAAGGNLLKMGTKGIFSTYFRKRMRAESDRSGTIQTTRREFRTFLEKVMNSETVPEPPEKWFLTDPLVLARRNVPRNVLMIHGLFDLVVPPSCAIELRNSINSGKIVWLPASHFTLFVFDKYIQRLIADFFESYGIFGERSPLLMGCNRR